MIHQFVEHYVFEFLEPESLTLVGGFDLLDVKDVLSEKNFIKDYDQEFSNKGNIDQMTNITFIETDLGTDLTYLAGLKYY